jgi:hypothetical protein
MMLQATGSDAASPAKSVYADFKGTELTTHLLD